MQTVEKQVVWRRTGSARSCFSTVRTALGKLRITGLLARFDVARSFPPVPTASATAADYMDKRTGSRFGIRKVPTTSPPPHLPDDPRKTACGGTLLGHSSGERAYKRLNQFWLLFEHRKTNLHFDKINQLLERLFRGLSVAPDIHLIDPRQPPLTPGQPRPALPKPWQLRRFEQPAPPDRTRPLSLAFFDSNA